jgi:hypothetical protein
MGKRCSASCKELFCIELKIVHLSPFSSPKSFLPLNLSWTDLDR